MKGIKLSKGKVVLRGIAVDNLHVGIQYHRTKQSQIDMLYDTLLFSVIYCSRVHYLQSLSPCVSLWHWSVVLWCSVMIHSGVFRIQSRRLNMSGRTRWECDERTFNLHQKTSFMKTVVPQSKVLLVKTARSSGEGANEMMMQSPAIHCRVQSGCMQMLHCLSLSLRPSINTMWRVTWPPNVFHLMMCAMRNVIFSWFHLAHYYQQHIFIFQTYIYIYIYNCPHQQWPRTPSDTTLPPFTHHHSQSSAYDDNKFCTTRISLHNCIFIFHSYSSYYGSFVYRVSF